MKFFQLIPSGTTIEFVAHKWRYIAISLVAIAISLGAMIYNHVTTGSFLNFGIDFAGGSQIRLALDPEQDPGIDAVRSKLEELGYQGSSAVVVPDQEHEIMIRVKEVVSFDDAALEKCQHAVQEVPSPHQEAPAKLLHFNHPDGGSKLFLKYDAEPEYRVIERLINEAGCEGHADRGFGGEHEFPVEFALIGMGAKLQVQLDEAYGAGTVSEIVHSETVGAKVGGQLKEDAAKAMLYAIGFIFLYVMIRFDLRFAPGGIVALAHDAFLMIGAFALTGKEFNLQTVAAVLTIVGYSINDTIVVFDRIRERVALHRDVPIDRTTNAALNDTLSRTFLTAGTTLLVILATYFMGSGAIKDFAFALIIGMVVGTYSSLYIATPVFLWINERFYAGRGHLQWVETTEREGTGTLLGAEGGTESGEPDALAVKAGTDGGPEDEASKKTRRRRRRPSPGEG